MIMSASSLSMKEVIQNIDANWIEPMIERLIEWNIKYLEVDTVKKIHGDKHAQAWAQIKQFGKTSFMNWQATGTSSFMQKEVLTSKLNAFSQFALGNQLTAPLIDARELLNQTWDALEVGRESPILKEEGELPPEAMKAVEMVKQQAGQQIQQLQQQIEQMGQALQQAQSGEAKAQAEMQMKMQLAQVDAQIAAEKQKTEIEMKQHALLVEQQFKREQAELQAHLDTQRTRQEIKAGLEKAKMEIRSKEEIAELNAYIELQKIGKENTLLSSEVNQGLLDKEE